MQKIALIELHRHSEVVRGLAQLLLHAGYDISIFTNEAVKTDFNLVQMHQIKWYVQKEGINKTDFLKAHTQLSFCDLLIFTTLAADFKCISKLNIAAPKVLLIHNGYTFTDPHRHFAFFQKPGLKTGLLMFRFYLLRREYWQQKALQTFDYHSFSSNEIKEHLLSRHPNIANRLNIISALPFSYFEGQQNQPSLSSNSVTVVIPGSIKTGIRDYTSIMIAFKILMPKLSNHVKLVLLGAANKKGGADVILQFESLKSKKIEVISFDAIVDQNTYDHWLQKADFLILPLRKYVQVSAISEYYGYSNISGTINDMLRFGKATLLTSYYPLPDELEQLTERYHSTEELADKLFDWIQNGTHHRLSTRAPELVAEYTLEKRAAALSAILTPILSQ